MLITTCTHCLARFRVTPLQLNAKQGQVRCGRCHKVFSGFEALERFPDDDTGTRLLAARDAQIGEAAGTLPEFDESADTRFDDATPEVSATPPAAGAIESPPEPPHRPSRAFVEPPAPTPSRPLPARPRPVLEMEPPPPPRPSRAWGFAAALMLLILLGELAYGYRGAIAQRYPVARPWLEAACARVGCAVPWPREDGLLKLEESELNEVPGRPAEIALGARVRNLATFAQEYPYIELSLTDATGQLAARRVLRPAEYLGRPLGAGEALAAGADVSIQLRLETPRVKPTGYELLLFYP